MNRELTMRTGVNMDRCDDWSVYMFSNLCRNRRRVPDEPVPPDDRWWHSHKRPVKWNDNGWPANLAPGESAYIKLASPNEAPVRDLLQPGRFTISYQGRGEVRIRLRLRQASEAPGWITLKPGVDVEWYARAESDIPVGFEVEPLRNDYYIKEIKIFKNKGRTGSFMTSFVDAFKAMQVVRWMDALHTNNSPERRWDGRVEPAHIQGAGGHQLGIAWEYIVEFSKLAGRIPWINIPHQASAEYVTYVATLFIDLPQVYVEYSNEPWNAGFQQHSWLRRNYGQHWWIGQAGKVQWLKQLWNKAVGHANHKHVLGCQAVNAWLTERLLENCEPDIIAIAPYFGEEYSRRPDELIGKSPDTVAEMLYQTMPWRQVQEQADIAKNNGIEISCYEGGPHLRGVYAGTWQQQKQFVEDVIVPANQSEAMGDLYHDMLLRLDGIGFESFIGWAMFDKSEPNGVNRIYKTPKHRAIIDFHNEKYSPPPAKQAKEELLKARAQVDAQEARLDHIQNLSETLLLKAKAIQGAAFRSKDELKELSQSIDEALNLLEGSDEQ